MFHFAPALKFSSGKTYFIQYLMIWMAFSRILHAENLSEEELKKEPEIRIYFYTGTHGHTALEVREGSLDPHAKYLSYARGNNRLKDYKEFGLPSLILTLPLLDSKNLVPYYTWFSTSLYGNSNDSSYQKNYSLVKKNCAHAVLEGLKVLGYALEWREPIRPRELQDLLLNFKNTTQVNTQRLFLYLFEAGKSLWGRELDKDGSFTPDTWKTFSGHVMKDLNSILINFSNRLPFEVQKNYFLENGKRVLKDWEVKIPSFSQDKEKIVQADVDAYLLQFNDYLTKEAEKWTKYWSD